MCSHAAVPVVVLCFGVAGASGGCVGIAESRAGGLAIDWAARQPPARPSAVPGASRAVVDGHVDAVPGVSPPQARLPKRKMLRHFGDHLITSYLPGWDFSVIKQAEGHSLALSLARSTDPQNAVLQSRARTS